MLELKELENEQKIMKIQNEQLTQDVDKKSKELAVSTMNLIKKTELLNFIGRYHLAGATTSVKWVADSGAIQTSFITDDQNVVGTVINTKMNLGETELGVFATPQLVKMLTAVSDDLDVKINQVGDKAVSLGINDGDVNMTFMLADLSVIRQVPELKQLPDWNMKVNIDKDFIGKFIKAKNALQIELVLFF